MWMQLILLFKLNLYSENAHTNSAHSCTGSSAMHLHLQLAAVIREKEQISSQGPK